MPHKVWVEKTAYACRRCGSKDVRVSEYHFGNTYEAHCAGCAADDSKGGSPGEAIARVVGARLDDA